MKRFHVHIHVQDLQASVAFYSKLFSTVPTKIETDYAKWMLEDPRVNFAISTRGNKPGLDHFGFQVDSAEELTAMKETAQSAEMATIDEGQTTCCYARSEKHWITDPQGFSWEHFHTLGDIPVFNENTKTTAEVVCCVTESVPASACCTPTVTTAVACCGTSSSKSAFC
jgi:predicted enzyme related to lactoylglutathione lyase